MKSVVGPTAGDGIEQAGKWWWCEKPLGPAGQGEAGSAMRFLVSPGHHWRASPSSYLPGGHSKWTPPTPSQHIDQVIWGKACCLHGAPLKTKIPKTVTLKMKHSVWPKLSNHCRGLKKASGPLRGLGEADATRRRARWQRLLQAPRTFIPPLLCFH